MKTTAEDFFSASKATKKADADSKAMAATTPVGGNTFNKGQRVQARFLASIRGPVPSCKWLNGRIVDVRANGTYRIEYEDGGDEDNVLGQWVRPRADEEEESGEAGPSSAAEAQSSRHRDVEMPDPPALADDGGAARKAETKNTAAASSSAAAKPEKRAAAAAATVKAAAAKKAKKEKAKAKKAKKLSTKPAADDSDGDSAYEKSSSSSSEESSSDEEEEESSGSGSEEASSEDSDGSASSSEEEASSDDDFAAKQAQKKKPSAAPVSKKPAATKKKPAAKKPSAASKPAPKKTVEEKPKAAAPAAVAKPVKGKGKAPAADDDDDDDDDDELGGGGGAAAAPKKKRVLSDDDEEADFADEAALQERKEAARAERAAKAEAAAEAAAAKLGVQGKVPSIQSASWQAKEKMRWTEEQVEELPVLTKPEDMFRDIVRVAEARSKVRGGALEGTSFKELASSLEGRPLRVATMCSGTESPLLALDLMCKALKEQHGVTLNVEHAFSCEIEPFKQAYIERNFAPPLLFRDIRELGNDEATTAYGASKVVPGMVDVLIAGTSCVDYSNLNTKQKGIDQKGESGQTFWGMLGWARKHRPPIIIQENVCGAPWDQMCKYYEKEGYGATFLRVDTKQHYVPHTRTRVYLLAIDMTAPNRRKRAKAEAAKAEAAKAEAAKAAAAKAAEAGSDDGAAPMETGAAGPSAGGEALARVVSARRLNELPRWLSSINELSRPSSSSLEAFLLPSDDPRVHRGRADLAKKGEKAADRKVVDWGRCITRHERARAQENLGNKRPLTRWVSQGKASLPDFAWHDWGKAQVERVLDLMDINFLRGVSDGSQDACYKTLVWNLSQNVDRETGASKPGLCPCLTPNMVPYVTNRGGPLIGHEVLSLQGIPVDDLLLTRESTDQMADLAGNAMTSTIVGTCLLAAVLLGADSLYAFEGTPVHAEDKALAAAGGLVVTSAELATSSLPLGAMKTAEGAITLGELARQGAASARMCTSEGRTELAENTLKCTECGSTVSEACRGYPEHANLVPLDIQRVPPAEFEGTLKAALPMCMQLQGLGDLEAARPEGELIGEKLGERLPPTSAEGETADEAAAAAGPSSSSSSAPAPADKSATKGKEGKAAAPEEPPKKQKIQMGIGAFFKPKAAPAPAPAEAAASDSTAAAAADGGDAKPAGSKASKKPKAGSPGDALWDGWIAAVTKLEGQRFYFHSVTRAEQWTATFASAFGCMRLVLSEKRAEWRLYANAPTRRGHLRDLLLAPVARMRVDVTGSRELSAASSALLAGKWELCLPSIATVELCVTAVGEPVDSWQASIGLNGPWDGHSRFKEWAIGANAAARACLDVDVSGKYVLLPLCGGAMGSLHKRVSGGDGQPLFFFLDPSRTGHGNEDSFVFASSFERLPYGEERLSVAELDKAWRPWAPAPPGANAARGAKGKKAAEAVVTTRPKKRPKDDYVKATVRGRWQHAPAGFVMAPVAFATAAYATPALPPKVPVVAPVVAPSAELSAELSTIASATASAAPPAIPIMTGEVPLLRSETLEWPEGAWGAIELNRSTRAFGSIAWVTERLALPDSVISWSRLKHPNALQRWASGSSPCDACAPAMPKLEWVASGRGKMTAVEDPVQAGAYEQRLKRRPPPFTVERRIDAFTDSASGQGSSAASKAGSVQAGVQAEVLGQLRIAANPMALAMRALALLPPSGLSSKAKLEWRIVRHSDLGSPLPKLTLSSNKHDAPAAQPEHFQPFKGRPSSLKVYPLRVEQQRSLAWMLRQEAEDAEPFVETEVAEGVLPALRWRIEARATVPHVARGGVLADEVGYGKTAITIALIDAAPRIARTPPTPLRPDGFLPTKATLVLAPSHLLKQWPREVQKFSGGALKCTVISSMAELNKLTIRELQELDVVVCSITLLRNDLYFSRLANFAAADELPASKTTNQRHFHSAYGGCMEHLQEQIARLSTDTAEGVEAARAAVKSGQARRKAARAAGRHIGAGLGNTANRLASGLDLSEQVGGGLGLGVALKGKKATYAAEKRAAKKAKTEAEDEAEEMEDEEVEEEESEDEEESEEEESSDDDDDDDDESDDDAPKKRKAPAKKKTPAAKKKQPAAPKAPPEEADPWGLMGSRAASDYTSLKACPLECFYWNRLVVDEYTYNREREYIAIVHGLKAHARWVLSGTPDISGFAAVSGTAQWLGVHLGAPDASDLTAKEKKEQSAVERFQFFNEGHTPSWYAARHGIAQSFLDRYVRQNIAEIDEIPWREQAVSVPLPAAERALYVELQNHLEALDMKNNHKTIKSKCRSENDREARLAQVLVGSESPEEALLKRAAHFDLEGTAKTAVQACDAIIDRRRHQLELCKQELTKQVAYARDAIDAFEKVYPVGKLEPKDKEYGLRTSPRENFNQWQTKEVHDCGDDDANKVLQPLIRDGLATKLHQKVKFDERDKGLKDRMAWTRDQVHLLRRLQKEITGRVRSLRFFENVRTLQQGGSASSSAAAIAPGTHSDEWQCPGAPPMALLSCCGHVGEASLVAKAAAQQTCIVASCKAPARSSCVINVSELGSQQADSGGALGVKLSSVVRLVKTAIPGDERILIFVQFVDLLVKVADALAEANVRAVQLLGTAKKRSEIIEAFQTGGELKPGQPRVLLLNLRDESAAGANLTAASHAIFVHPLLVSSQQEYNSCDTQAVGRIRRYGQERTVQLYRFLVPNSIDEDIFRSRRAEDADELLANAAAAQTVKPAE